MKCPKSIVLVKFQLELSSARWLTNSKYNNTVHAKSLTVTDHSLAMRALLASLQCAPKTKRQNIFQNFVLIVQSLKLISHKATTNGLRQE